MVFTLHVSIVFKCILKGFGLNLLSKIYTGMLSSICCLALAVFTLPRNFWQFSLCIFFYRFHSAYFKFTVISSEITLVLNSLTHTQMEKTTLFGPDIHWGIRGQRPWISQYFLIICVFPDKIVVGRGIGSGTGSRPIMMDLRSREKIFPHATFNIKAARWKNIYTLFQVF